MSLFCPPVHVKQVLVGSLPVIDLFTHADLMAASPGIMHAPGLHHYVYAFIGGRGALTGGSALAASPQLVPV